MTTVKELAVKLDGICNALQYHPSGQWGAETIEPIREAISVMTTERKRIDDLLSAIREHWVKANGEDSISVSALDRIAEVIADGSYVQK
jgi:hypothetical protein